KLENHERDGGPHSRQTRQTCRIDAQGDLLLLRLPPGVAIFEIVQVHRGGCRFPGDRRGGPSQTALEIWARRQVFRSLLWSGRQCTAGPLILRTESQPV